MADQPKPRRTVLRVAVGAALAFGQVVMLPFAPTPTASAAPAMTVTKTASPASGSTVGVGDTISYTVQVVNTSTASETLTGLDVIDNLPAGVSYVAGTSMITGATTVVDYADNFASNDPDNSDGATDWSTNPWVFSSGDVKINGGQFEQKGLGETGERAIPLGSCVGGTSTIAFDWSREAEAGAVLELFNPATGTWAPQANFAGTTATSSAPYSLAIPSAFHVGGAKLRFNGSGEDDGRKFFVDNLSVTQTGCPVATSAVEAGAPPNLTGGIYSLAAGATATLTFDVTVDALPDGDNTGSFANQASATTAEITTPVTSSSVTHNVVEAAVTKSAVPASGSTVSTGDTITYTIDIENFGAATLDGFELSDAVPTGASYVPGSATITGVRDLVQYIDNFDAQVFNGSDGATAWASTPWVPVGSVSVQDDGTPADGREYVLQIDDDGVASRPIDLSACASGTASVSFDWRKSEDLDGEIYFELFNSTTSTWVTQATFSGLETTSYETYSQAIDSQFLTAGAELRFRGSAANTKKFLADEVRVNEVCSTENPTPTVGDPPNLVTTADAYAIGGADTATITFQVTVDGTEQVLDNIATMTTSRNSVVTSNTVTHNVEFLTVTKSNSPDDAVLEGETISYTIDIENVSTSQLTGLVVSDILPPGVTYVGGSAAITGALQQVQYRDEFTTQAYDNSNGITDWTTNPWVEAGDDGSVSGGRVLIDNGVLEFRGEDPVTEISRPIPLPNCATGAATLSFLYDDDDINDTAKIVDLQLSTDGSTWVTQAQFTQTAATGWQPYTQTVPSTFMVAGTEVRFVTDDDNLDKTLLIDDFDLSATCDAVTVGDPPDLVESGDNYAIAPGGTATITFDVTVDTLTGGLTELLLENTATASTAEVATVTSNTVDNLVVTFPSFEGNVYFDKDGSGTLNAGDPSSQTTPWAKLISGGSVTDVTQVDLATGFYEFKGVPAGTYTIIIDDNDTVGDTTPAPPGTWSFATPATGTLTAVSDGVPQNDVTGLDFGLTRDVDLEVDKSVDVTEAYEAASVTYTVSLTNLSTTVATEDVVVNDVVPSGVTYSSHSGPGTYTPGTGDWEIDDLAPLQTVQLVIIATVDDTATAPIGSTITNTATVTDQLALDPVSGNDTDSAAFDVVAPPTADIAVTKVADVSTAGFGDPVEFTIVVTNNGPDDIAGGLVNDLLPSDLEFLTYSTTPIGPTGGTYDEVTGDWLYGALADGESKTLVINAKVVAAYPSPEPDPYEPLNLSNTATAIVAAPVVDPTPGNNSATVDVDVDLADLSLVKTANVSTAELLSDVVFTLTLTNDGPGAANDIVVDDLVPSGFLLQGSVPSAGTTYDQGLWSIPTLADGAVATLEITTKVVKGGQQSNTAEIIEVDGLDPDSTPGNGILSEDDMDRATVIVTNSGAVTPGLPGAVCYAIADSNNLLTRVVRDSAIEEAIGTGLGASAEASAIDPVSGVLYTVSDNGAGIGLGTVDLISGVFSDVNGAVGNGSGTGFELGSSTLTTVAFNDVDGMHFDPTSGFLYASVRRSGVPDLLIRLDPATGTHVPNAFDSDNDSGTVEDFVVIEPVGGLLDIDALAVDLDGTLYGLANAAGTGNQTLVRIDKTTGETTIAGVMWFRPDPFGDPLDDILMQDIEGMSIDLQGQLYVVTGGAGLFSSGFHDVDKTPISDALGTDRIIATSYFDLAQGDDYEALTCGVPPTDIEVVKTVNETLRSVGEFVEFTITVTNNGPTVATGIQISDVVPTGLGNVSTVSISQGAFSPATGLWDLGGLLVDGSATLTIRAQVLATAPSRVVNTAEVAERLPGILAIDQPDSDPTNNSDDAEFFVGVAPADIRGAVYDDGDANGSISVGDVPIPGVLIELFETDINGDPVGAPIATTTTLADGTYVFEDVPAGSYLIVENDPPNLVSVTDIDGVNDNSIAVVMNGVDSSGNDFLDVNTTDAQNDINQTPVNVPVSGSVTTNDTDDQGDGQTVTSALADTDGDGQVDDDLPLGVATTVWGTDESGTLVVAGTLELNADGSYDYVPATDFKGDVPASYVITDDNPLSPTTDDATLTIDVFGNVVGANDPPVAQDDTNTTEIGIAVGANLIDPNDTDPDGDALTVTGVLMDTDGDGLADDTVAVGTSATVYGTDVYGNVVPAGDLVVNANGDYTFTPNATFVGDVPAEYTIEDPGGLSDDATLTITIEPKGGNNTGAYDDFNSGPINIALSGDVSDNDYDAQEDGQTVTTALADTDGDGNVDDVLTVGVATTVYSTVVGEQAGTLTLNSDGTYTFVPVTDFTGTVPAIYTVTDDHPQYPATAAANLTLEIVGDTPLIPDAPVALDDDQATLVGKSVSGDVLGNDLDPDLDVITVSSVLVDSDGDGSVDDSLPLDTPTEIYGTNQELAGTLTMDALGQYTFVPAPTFTGEVPAIYTVTDGGGLTDTADLTIDVVPRDGTNTFANDDANSGPEDLIQTGNIIDNDFDPEGDDQDVGLFDTDGDGLPDTVPVAGTPFNITQGGSLIGTLEIDPETGDYIWDPVPGYIGTAVVPYTATDGTWSDTATLYLTTLPVEAQVGDFVWLDVDNDGVQDAGEPGFEGATVWLLDDDGNVVDSTVTDATGAYNFSVDPGDYRITVTGVPSTFTTQDAGGDDDVDSDVNASGSTGIFTVNPGDAIDNIDIGVSSIPLGDYVWRDNNENGIQDPGEPGIQGVTVNLYDDGGALIDTTTTGVNGDYLFTGLTPGADYTVEVVSPDFGFTAADQGTDDRVDSDVDASGFVTLTLSSACPPEFNALTLNGADAPTVFPTSTFTGGGTQVFGGSGATENFDASFANGQSPYDPHPDWVGNVRVQTEHLDTPVTGNRTPNSPQADSNAFHGWFDLPTVRVTSVSDFNWNNVIGDGGQVYRVNGRGSFFNTFDAGEGTKMRYTVDFTGLNLGYLPAGTHIAFTDIDGPGDGEDWLVSATGPFTAGDPFLSLESTTAADPHSPLRFIGGNYDFFLATPSSNGSVIYVTSENLTTLTVEVDQFGGASTSFKMFAPLDCDNTLSGADAGILPNTTDAQNDINQTPVNVPVSGSVATNDTDAQGDGQTVTSALVDTDGDGLVDETLPIGTTTSVYGTNELGAIVVAGTLTLNADGSYDYVPALDFEGTVPAIYTVTDDNAGGVATDTATLTIEVMGNGDLTLLPPVAQDDTNSTEIGVPVSANVITPNDSDPEGQALTVVGVLMDTDGDGLADDTVAVGTSTPVYGTDVNGNVVLAGDLVVNSDGTYTLTPNDTFVGDVPAEYTIEDTDNLTDDATLTITIEPDRGNSTFANDDANIGPEDLIQTGNIIDNDNDAEGDDQDVGQIDTNGDGTPDTAPVAGTPVDITQGGAVIGTLEIDPETGDYIWDPVPGYIGTAVVPYTVNDDGTPVASDTATLYLTTLPVNTTDAQNDINQTPVNTPVSGSVATNDTDAEGDGQTVTSALVALDPDGLVNDALVIGAAPVTVYGTDDSGATVVAGTLALNADGSYDYVPALDFTGTVPAEYTVTDDNANGPATDDATLTIEVFGPTASGPNPPVAQDDTNTTEVGVTVSDNVITPNDYDPFDQPLTVTDLVFATDPDGIVDDTIVVGTPTDIYGTDINGNVVPAGELTINSDGSYTLVPDPAFAGEVVADYTITDTEALSDSATLTITIVPDEGNSTFTNDDANEGPEDLIQTGNIIDNDFDPEGDDQDIVSIDTDGDGTPDTTPVDGVPLNLTQGGSLIGTLTINPETGDYVYDPVPGYIGTAVVPYTVNDDGTPVADDTATLYLTTWPLNTTDAQNDINRTPINTPVSGDLSTNDVDAEGDGQTVTEVLVATSPDGLLDDALTVYAPGDPGATPTTVYGTDNSGATVEAGTLVVFSDGSYDYVPALDFTGDVPAIYTVTDDNGDPATDDATLTIEVFGDVPLTNDPPVANDDTNTTEIGVPVSANVMIPNDSDPDGDPITVVDVLFDTDGDGIADDAGGTLDVGETIAVYGTDLFGNTVPAGTLVINADGSYTFTPNSTFVGDVVGEYTISDDGTTDPGRTDSATLTITIEPDEGNSTYANDDANAGPQDLIQTGNILGNDVDLELDTQSITLIDTNGDGTPDTAPVAGTALPIFQNSVQIGTLDLDPDTGDYIWDPVPTYIGTAVVPYTIVDDGVGPATDDATLYLTTYPGIDYDDAPASYGDAAALIAPDLRLGTDVTQDGALPGDDADSDDGPDFDNARVTATGYELDVAVTNTTGDATEVCGWIDLDGSGTFEPAEEDCEPVPNGATSVTLSWSGVGGLTGNSWTRFRIAPTGLASAVTGPAGIGEVEDFPINLSTLPVTLTYFSSTTGGSVTWWTSTETNNAGFIVYGENADGELVAVTDFIVGSGDSLTPLEYTTTVPSGFDVLWLADIDNNGVEVLHGPYALGDTVGQVPTPVAIEWGRAVPSRGVAEVVPGAKSVVRRAAGPATGSAVEVEVTESGLQRVSFEDLVSAGVDWTGARMNRLAVIDAAGEPVPVTSRFRMMRPGSYLEFAGDPVDTLYTGTNVYRLVVDESLVVRMGVDRSRPPRGTSRDIIESGAHTAVFEEQVVFSSSSPGDEPWFWQRAVSFFGGQGSASFTVPVDGLVAGDASIAVEVWGASENAGDRTVALSLNGTEIATAQFAGIEVATLSGAIPDGVLIEGDNTVAVTVQGPAGVLLDVVDVDSITLDYQRNLAAVDGAADVTGVVGRVEVDGFTTRDITVVRLDANGAVTQVRRAMTVPQGDGTFSVRFSSSSADARYMVAQGSGAAVASVDTFDEPVGLLDGAADLLIISHSAFSDHLGDLVAAREAQGLDVKVVEVEDLYAAYTGGVLDPAAISEYIADAAVAFGDPAVLLVGADSYDYLDNTGAGSTAYIPTLYGNVGVGNVNWSPIDPKFVDLDGDDVPDLALGRFPVRNLGELEAMIAKTLAYGNDGTAVFTAEQGFKNNAADIAAELDGYTVTTAYLDDMDVATAHDTVMAEINAGAGLTVYFGHSSPDQWATGGLMRTSDVVDMTNTLDPTMVVQFGCWNTYFSDPVQQSLGVAMATHTGGAAGVVGATTLTNSIHDAMFGAHLASALDGAGTIGEALNAAKASLEQVTPAADISLGWTLLGDPTAPIEITP